MLLQAGDSDAALDARQRAMRPPPGSIPLHNVRASAPQAALTILTSSSGRNGRSTSVDAAGAAAGATVSAGAAAVVDAAAPAAGVAVLPPALATAF
jgi:ApbE superfamily uncharacterized protein (UPF0280 family)